MLEAKDVRVVVGGKEIIPPFTGRFQEGTVSVAVGLNGAGKSTLLRALAGFLSSEGTVLVDGRPLGRMRPKERARYVSFLPQHLPIPEMDVETLTAHGRYSCLGISHVLSQTDRDAIERAMTWAGIGHLRTRGLRTLSGGERQRAFLAMIIAQDTPVILLDEPDTYMDIAYKQELLGILRKLKENGKTVIMASHDLPQSFLAADRILVMRSGTVIADGSPSQTEALRESLRKAMGVSVRRLNEEGLCYPYALEWEPEDAINRE